MHFVLRIKVIFDVLIRLEERHRTANNPTCGTGNFMTAFNIQFLIYKIE
jgi:hypothetical protein